MKIFISWSGPVSHSVAIALRDWLPLVIQTTEPYVSSEDIEKGARWSAEIGQQLEETAFGILCVTPHNLNSPWLNFEAGALSKSLDTSRVSPFLMGIRPAELIGPLAQFQATLPRLDDLLRLMKAINNASEQPIEQSRLADIANTWWPRLEERLNAASKEQEGVPQEAQRDPTEMIEEVLEITRGMQRQIAQIGTDTSVSIRTSSSPSLEEIDGARTVINGFLTTMLPDRSWVITENDEGILVKFHKSPMPLVWKSLSRLFRNHPVSVTIQLPKSGTDLEGLTSS